MSARDELALILVNTQRARYDLPPRETTDHCSETCWAEVDAIRAAGYRKPRIINSAKELDALPFETVIRDGDECVLERWGDMEESGWVTVMVTSFVPRDQITLPATVLYEGGQA
jgi:hypothetical protein